MASLETSDVHAPDPFDALLSLEDTLHQQAYALGASDGRTAGRIEGRIFGLEKGFEKFASMGVLHGRAAVWGSRLERANSQKKSREVEGSRERDEKEEDREEEKGGATLPVIPAHQRIERNIHLLHHLTDPLTFSTENSEDGVADLEDRFKRAGAKAKVIERILGETSPSTPTSAVDGGAEGERRAEGIEIPVETELETEIRGESKGRGKPKAVKRVNPTRVAPKSGRAKGTDDSMEDFEGSRLLR